MRRLPTAVEENFAYFTFPPAEHLRPSFNRAHVCCDSNLVCDLHDVQFNGNPLTWSPLKAYRSSHGQLSLFHLTASVTSAHPRVEQFNLSQLHSTLCDHCRVIVVGSTIECFML